MTIYLVDRTYDVAEPEDCEWFKSFKRVFKTSFRSGSTQGENYPPTEHGAYTDSEAVIFAHSNGGESDWRTKANNVGCHIVLVRNSGGQGAEANGTGNLHGCWWSPDQFAEKSRPLEFIKQVIKGDTIDWTLLQPENSEALLAAQLICDAADNELDTHGISIHIPDRSLLEKARAVVKAKEEGWPLENEITALNSALGVDSEP